MSSAQGQQREKTYEEILSEYEKFFSLDEELIKSQETQKKRSSASKKVGSTMGTNYFAKVDVSFAESIVGVQKYVNY